MGLILWIVFGALVGFIASNIMGRGDGLVWDIILGIIGSIVGGFIMTGLGQSGISGFNLYSLIVGVVGAIVVIYISRFFRQKHQN